MAELEANQRTERVEDNERELKYLDFVQVAAIYFFVCFSTIYEYAKENSGPLKAGVQTVEGTVKTVIGPVYEKFQDVPFELLKFADRKVDESLSELDRYVPSLVKQVSSQARVVASEVQRAGVVDASKIITRNVYTKYEPTAKELYGKYEPMAEQYAVAYWRLLNRLPLFTQVAQIAVPTAAYWSKKYNRAVCYATERGHAAACYLPVIPVERIAKMFGETESRPTVSTNGESAVAQ
ncbi:stress-related protein-like [Tripterygium wilfordii]|uniref:stress-related protein-like n=1 Tax=Tripterygium wilfordii TaxID=458696 RepID=UPI0018F84E0D|nr:stress-related protein-like [Tripterygium wilfordii]